MSQTPSFHPPINLRTGQISAKMCGMAILRPLPDGSYIGFKSTADAIGHATAKVVATSQAAA